MVKIQNFHEALERDLARLTAEIKEQQKAVESGELSEREIIKKSLKSLSSAISPQVTQAAADEEEKEEGKISVLPSYLESGNVDPKVKAEVEQLVDLVFHRGLGKAFQEAKRKPAFIEDAFHDALVDKLLPELKRRGIIK